MTPLTTATALLPATAAPFSTVRSVDRSLPSDRSFLYTSRCGRTASVGHLSHSGGLRHGRGGNIDIAATAGQAVELSPCWAPKSNVKSPARCTYSILRSTIAYAHTRWVDAQ